MAGGRRKGGTADCRADTRGGPWAGIPLCVINSAAYRDLSLHARAVLVEIVARMNGWNNGAIGVSQREIQTALRCTPRYVVASIAELMEHGFIDVTVAGDWKSRLARQYRLTFVSTKAAKATNDYVTWTPTAKKKCGSQRETEGDSLASQGETVLQSSASQGETVALGKPQKCVTPLVLTASQGEPLIHEPYPGAPAMERERDQAPISNTPYTAGHRCGDVTEGEERCCEQCGGTFTLERSDRAYPRRFCSETCRKRAERARAAERRKRDSPPEPVGNLAGPILERLKAGANAR